jgi:fatty-acyl-CoA synthase
MPLNWLDRTPYAAVETRARIYPEHVALHVADPSSGDFRPFTYGRLHDEIYGGAGRLWAAGVRPGLHVGIWADNSVSWLASWLATSLLGGVTVALNTRLTAREAGELIAATDVGIVLVGGRPVEEAQALSGGLDVFALDGADEFPALPDVSDFEAAPVDGDRIGLIQFTSGSTGLPKGVQLREGAVAALGASCASRWLLSPLDRVFSVFSFAHNAGTTFTTMAAFTSGASLVLPTGSWAGGAGITALEQSGATVLPSLDTIVGDLLKDGRRPPSLRLVVGGFDSIAARRLTSELGVEISNTYGLTEVTANVTVGDLRDLLERRIERIGRPHPGHDVRIVGEDGAERAAGEPGEIQIRGWATMTGYYGTPDSEQPFTPDGWLLTGDIGSVDGDGYVSFLGRAKDVIRSGGENVGAFEVERYLETHPDVLQAAVVAAPDPRYGEVPCAFVRLRGDAALTGEDLVAYCHGRLAVFKIPKYVEIVDSFPLVGINKVSKIALRERAAEIAAA